MLPIPRVALLLILALGGFPVFAEDKPPTPEAARARFAKADRDLNEAWGEAKKNLSGDRFADLKSIQRGWIAFRDERAEAAGGAGQPKGAKSQSSSAYHTAAARLTEDRAHWLRRLAKGEEDTLTGLWIDGQGGTVAIVEQKERLLFDLQVVRGRTASLGVLAGIAGWKQGVGSFSDQGRRPGKTGVTTVSFLRQDLRLKITSENAGEYLGNHAYFAGDYFKAAPLDSEAQARTVRAAESGQSSAQ